MSDTRILEYNRLRKIVNEYFENGGSSMTNAARSMLEEIDELWRGLTPEEQSEVE